MWLITNRNVTHSGSNLTEKSFGESFNAVGPDELRLARVIRRSAGNFEIDVLGETSRSQTFGAMLPSEVAFLKLQKKMCDSNRNCVFFIHGFNNNLEDILERCHKFERNFNVEAIAFSWPANGGTLGFSSYRSDKRDAKMSVNALDRTFEKLQGLLNKHRATDCKRTINLVLHSMGNYLLKSLLVSSVYNGETLLFDNVVMAAADTNNEGHAGWVDRIKFRNRLYICINEDDTALAASRAKFGDQQLARLGHLTRNLNSRHAHYLDFTNAKKVGSAHAYFEDKPLKNPNVKAVFSAMFNGKRAEDTDAMDFDSSSGAWRVN